MFIDSMNSTNDVYHSYLLCDEDNEGRNINYVAYFLKAVKKVKMVGAVCRLLLLELYRSS